MREVKYKLKIDPKISQTDRVKSKSDVTDENGGRGITPTVIGKKRTIHAAMIQGVSIKGRAIHVKLTVLCKMQKRHSSLSAFFALVFGMGERLETSKATKNRKNPRNRK